MSWLLSPARTRQQQTLATALVAALLAGAFLPNAPSGAQDMVTDRPDGRQ